MIKLFECADEYLSKSDWKDLALIKFCLIAIGLMLGMMIPGDKRKGFIIAAAIVFTGTFIPLMTKFIRIIFERKV